MKKLLKIVLFIILLMFIFGCNSGKKELQEKKTETTQKSVPVQLQKSTSDNVASAKAKSDILIPNYNEVDRERYDAPVKTQIVLHGVVTGKLTELGLKKLLRQLYGKAKVTRDFKHHGGKPTHVFIFLYPSKEHFESGGGLWVAMLGKTADDSRPLIQVKTKMLSQINEEPEMKRGLAEYKRKEIYKALSRITDKAKNEAHSKFPTPDPAKPGYSQEEWSKAFHKQADFEKELMTKYKTELLNQYEITKNQLTKIMVEGIENRWLE